MSHQWLRELGRWVQGQAVATYLRVPGDTPVLYGHYGGPHTAGCADEAVSALMHGDTKLGLEAMILRDVRPSEISRISRLRPITGLRYYPAAKGRKLGGCPACIGRGEPYGRRLRERFGADQG